MDYVALREDLQLLAAQFEREFFLRAGYPPGLHTVNGPSSEEDIGTLLRVAPRLGEVNINFYRHISAVSLPDLKNGFSLESPAKIVEGIARDRPTTLHGKTHRLEILCVGTDGGGAYFAVDLDDGTRVLYLPTARVEQAIYFEGKPGVQVAAESLPRLAEAWCEEMRNFLAKPKD
jgi:hypothetical protein